MTIKVRLSASFLRIQDSSKIQGPIQSIDSERYKVTDAKTPRIDAINPQIDAKTPPNDAISPRNDAIIPQNSGLKIF